MKKIFICAGEPSGDFHAGHLVAELKRLCPDLAFFGIGAQALQREGVRLLHHARELAVVGIWEVVRRYPAIRTIFTETVRAIGRDRPDLAILVDYPGFNLKLAEELHRLAIPVIYYISPQVWAWGKDRIRLIGRFVDTMIVFFSFEHDLYRTHGIDSVMVGHPLLDHARATAPRESLIRDFGLSTGKKTIALLPGSRATEVSVLLPIMLEAAAAIHAAYPQTQFIVARAADLNDDLYEEARRHPSLPLTIAYAQPYNVLSVSDLALVASGTATLETGLFGVPMLVIYKTAPLTWWIGRRFVHLAHIGLVNIVAGKSIVPELLQNDARPQTIAQQALNLLNNDKEYRRIKEDLGKLRALLGTPGASKRAAQVVADRLAKLDTVSSV